MKLIKKEADFIRQNREIISQIVSKRLEDCVSALLDEEDEKKRDILRLWAKEYKMALNTINNLAEIKDNKEEKDFTGI